MPRGELRVYLGAATGVGKTFAMLNEGRRRLERGTDVVVGFVETHGRARTTEQLEGLEVIPRRSSEMDVDAVLHRRPEVALVDELAHANVPGSRNARRWEDVAELLDAGIDVISTVNIQHLESLNDVVEGITGIKQRETIPDEIVRAAEQVQLVDSTPEELRRRLAHGNIYAAEKIDPALANYFRPGNLAALRELALMWVADKVDEGLEDYRERHGITAPWETRERVVVAITGAPGGDDLIRRAARMARRTKGELIGVHVQTGDGQSRDDDSTLAARRVLLEELGGRYHEVSGTDVPRALVQAARVENATQLVIGATRRSRWAELSRGSIVNGVIRESGDTVDVHVISTSADAEGVTELLTRPRRRRASLSRRRQLIGFALAVIGLPVMTYALAQVRDSIGLPNVLLCYLLLVVAVATIGGVWPALVASLLGFALLNWFFVPPIHTFTIAAGRDLLALFAFVVVAGVISTLVDLAARRRIDAYRARSEAAALARMAGTVLREADPLPELIRDLVTTFDLEGASVLAPSRDGWRPEAHAGPHPPQLPAQANVVVPLREGASLALRGSGIDGDGQRLLNAFASQLGHALETRRLQAEAATAETLARTNEVRTALLAAVSHDLRTPLASIKAAATSLLSDDVAFEASAVADLLQTIDGEADRLNDLVGNLLDMSRLQTGSLVVQPTRVGIDEVVGLAVASLPVAAERLDLDVPETLPRVTVDSALLERALANIVGNALDFSPSGERVRVQAGAIGDRVEIRVADRGRGIPAPERERVFQPFQRLGDDNPNEAGVGLGLAVARGFIEAIGGELHVDDTPGGGCTMVVSLPLGEP